MFRVLAVNAQGESEPLESFVPVCACPSNPVPEKPATPRIKEQDKRWVKLEWFMPQDANIKHYIVEKLEMFKVPKVEDDEEVKQDEGANEEEGENKEENAQLRPTLKRGTSYFSGEFQDYCSKWMTADLTNGKENFIKLADLGENHRYQFRIKAVNDSGTSEPSDPTEEIVCRNKQRPIIDRKIMEPVSVSRGENITLHAKFTGEPVPERAWYYGKTLIQASNTVAIQDKDHSSKLIIYNAREDDSGQFEFRVENEFGQETALIDVKVRVPPSKPKGPMRIDNVSAQGCSCSWQEPEEDGGSPVTHYVIEKLSNPNASSYNVCGKSKETHFNVTGLTEGKEYRIRVKAVNAEGESDPLNSVDSFVAENPFGVPTAPGQPEVVDGDVDYFIIVWDPPRNDGGSPIKGYELEARKWKDNAYFSAGEVKMQMQKGEVRNVELGQSYAVRVRAYNAAGPGAWSLDTEQLTVKHRALKPKINFVNASSDMVIEEGKSFKIEAEIEAEPPTQDITFAIGDNILMTDAKQGISVSIKPNKATLAVDSCTRRHNGKLSCSAQNIHGKGVSTINLKVQGCPSKPQGMLEVTNIHRNGCRLSWETSKYDGGLSIEYAVERRSAAGDNWSKIVSTSGTMIDVNDLEPGMEYEFGVKAVNEVGESETLFAPKAIVAKDQYSKKLTLIIYTVQCNMLL